MKTKTQSGIALATTLVVLFLIVALVVGFSWMVLMDQRLGGVNGSQTYTFYGAEAGLEKLTGDLATLFIGNSSPTGAQVTALATVATEPTVQGIQYLNPSGTIGYQITFPTDANGNPEATDHVIQSGNYQGMTGLLTPYTLTVTSRNAASTSEVRLTRTVQTVAIPVFQFGMFSQTDLSFFPGPPFNFGGNVMTNGNLFIATSTGPLVFGGKILSAKDIIRQTLSNGFNTNSGYTADVYVSTTAGGCPTSPSGSTSSCQEMSLTDGSLTGGLGTSYNKTPFDSFVNTTNGYVGSSEYPGSGVKPVNLSITLASGANPIDLIRRPVAGENSSNAALYSQRYYSQASMRILLSDNQADLDNLPCVDTTHNALPLISQTTATLGGVPIAESAAETEIQTKSGKTTTTNYYADNSTSLPKGDTPSYTLSGNGYWLPNGSPMITGYIKIEIENGSSYPTTQGACGSWTDVTSTVLGLGIAGRDLNPNTGDTFGATNYYDLPVTPTSAVTAEATNGCNYPSPNAIIRLERLRDNPSQGSNKSTSTACGNSSVSTNPFDYWPNALFDTREGNFRDLTAPPGSVGALGGAGGTNNLTNFNTASSFAYSTMPTVGGVINYTELDISNLVKFLTTNATGEAAKDTSNSTNDFTIYFSDRRSNYTSAAMPNNWPPLSPNNDETGEYGFEDSINPSSAYGCPNGTLDNGETFDMVENAAQTVGGTPEDYGETSPSFPTSAGTPVNASYPSFFTDLVTNRALYTNPNCSASPGIAATVPWPGSEILNAQEARENPTMFFRRALKIVNGSSINLGTCPDGEPCGLTIVSENPVYVQGDFNAASGGDVNNTPTQAHVATSIIADAVTLLSDSWNDVNSFISFSQPSTCGTQSCYQDFGTDGGVHNFLRYLENWGSATIYYRGSVVSFYYSRQGIGVYKDGLDNTVYNPPTRGYQFDSDFLTPALLPPRTPMFRDVNTVGFTQVVLPTQ